MAGGGGGHVFYVIMTQCVRKSTCHSPLRSVYNFRPTPIWIWNEHKEYKETNVRNEINAYKEHFQFEKKRSVKSTVLTHNNFLTHAKIFRTFITCATHFKNLWISVTYATLAKIMTHANPRTHVKTWSITSIPPTPKLDPCHPRTYATHATRTNHAI